MNTIREFLNKVIRDEISVVIYKKILATRTESEFFAERKSFLLLISAKLNSNHLLPQSFTPLVTVHLNPLKRDHAYLPYTQKVFISTNFRHFR